MHAVIAVLLLAMTPLDEPAWEVDSPQRIQQLVELYLKQQQRLAPDQNREVLNAVTAALKDPEIVRRCPTLSAVRKKELKQALASLFNPVREQPAYHTALYVKALTARAVQTIRSYTLADPEPAPTPEALAQVHALRALCERRILELYPGIRQFRRGWARILFELESMIKVQENDLTLMFKAALPGDQFERLLREIREIPAVTVGQGFSRAYFAIDRRQKGLRPPPPEDQLYEPGQTRIPWRDADHDTREAWLMRFGIRDFTRQYTNPIDVAYRALLPPRYSNRLDQFRLDEDDDATRELIRQAQAEENATYMRLAGLTPRGATRPDAAPPAPNMRAPSPPQPAPSGVAAQPLEYRNILVVIAVVLAAAALPLIALYVFGRLNRK